MLAMFGSATFAQLTHTANGAVDQNANAIVKKAAAKDGRLIAVLSANRGGCWWTQQFMPIAESPEFLAWAEANGVYLITSDDSELIDTEAADDYFWSLWGGGSVYYPTLVFARPSAPDASETETPRSRAASPAE